jgi:surface protein
MFYNSYFNGDISEWNVSNVYDMKGIFSRSNFNGDISKWDTRNITFMWERNKIEKLKMVLGKIKIQKKIEEGYEKCPVTHEIVKGDYMKCETCKHCFNMEMAEWVNKYSNCPYCSSKWKETIIYTQP